MIYSKSYVSIGGNLLKLKVQFNTSDDCEQKQKIGMGGTGSFI